MKDEGDRRSGVPRSSSFSGSSSQSEFDFIRTLRRRVKQRGDAPSSFIPHPSSLLVGIGDDAAVIKQFSGRDMVVSTDLLVEDIDFRRQAIQPRFLGHKTLAVSLSDIAAMGARPRWALLSLGVPQDLWEPDLLDEFHEGFFTLADRYDVRLIGGDVSRTPDRVVIDSIVLGECASGHSILRSGARPGDHLFVTGCLGGSAAAWRLIERGACLEKMENSESKNNHAPLMTQLLLRHLTPEPRVGWGLVLGEERLASAMIDISDGLSSDLHHLCNESRVGAIIEGARIPVDPRVTTLCGRRGLDPLLLALHGGEDFELLFSVSPENIARLPRKVDGVEVSLIGKVTDAPAGVRVAEADRVWNLEPGGWEHFRKDEETR